MKRQVEIRIDGQRFAYVGEAKVGATKRLAFAARCADCGHGFVQAASGRGAALGDLIRRCPACKNIAGGTRVLQLHSKARLPPPKLNPALAVLSTASKVKRPSAPRRPPEGLRDVVYRAEGQQPLLVETALRALQVESRIHIALRGLGLPRPSAVDVASQRLRDAGWLKPQQTQGHRFLTDAAKHALQQHHVSDSSE